MENTKNVRMCLCKHLRSKEMFHSSGPYTQDLYSSGIFWCNITQNGRGPDGRYVDIEECSAVRECFEE